MSGHQPKPTTAKMALESRPLYLQARDSLLRQISEGVLKPGDFLPSEQQIAADLGISIGTVRKAKVDLISQGVLERQHGRGTQIVPHTSDRARFRFFRFVHSDGTTARLTGRLLAMKTQSPSKEEQRRLALSKNDPVIVLTRIRREAGITLVYERICVPEKKFARLSISPGHDMLEELYVLYQKQCGEMVRSTVDQVQMDPAPAPVSKELLCEPGTPILLVNRQALSLSKTPIEFRQSWTQKLAYISRLD